MKYLKVWGYTIGIITTLTFLIVLLFYIKGEMVWQERSGRLTASEIPEMPNIKIIPDSQLISHGKRRAQTLQCIECHGADLNGEMREYGFVPSLLKTRHQYSNRALALAIKYGIKHDSTQLHPNMPTMRSFYHLNMYDLKAVIAYIRSIPDTLKQPSTPATNRPEPSMSTKMWIGYMHTTEDLERPSLRNRKGLPKFTATKADSPIKYGKYLTQTHCARCHSADLSGDPGYWQTPDVAVGAGYSSEQFRKLLTKGIALGNKDVGFMSTVAKESLSHLTDSEISTIHAYLKVRIENLNSNKTQTNN